LDFEKNKIEDEYLDLFKRDENNNVMIPIEVYSIGDYAFDQLSKTSGAILINNFTTTNFNNPQNDSIIKGKINNLKLYSNDNGQYKFLETINLDNIIKSFPLGVANHQEILTLIVRDELFEKLQQYESVYTNIKHTSITLKTNNINKVINQIINMKNEKYRGTNIDYYDTKEFQLKTNNLILIILIISYSLISFILTSVILNIINIIAINLKLRHKEIGIIRSMGVTSFGINKILFYDIFNYIIKGLIYGILFGTLINYIIYRKFYKLYNVNYLFPSIEIYESILGIITISLIIMLLASRSIKNKNIIDLIRGENT
jgi:putative ABC transport system permease protein